MTTKPMLDDSRLLALCASKGRESPDPKTKVGCVLVGPDRSVRSEACNTYPSGVLDGIQERTEAPLKYIWIEHAERNAIYLAARRGISTEGCTMVVELIPCVECARAIIQAGVVQVVINEDRSAEYRGDWYSGEHSTALAMLAEAGIAVRFVSPRLEPLEGEEAPSGGEEENGSTRGVR
jgi:dCMP deaminase